MAITLTDGTTPITLRDDALWADEFGWPGVVQQAEYSLTGALIVETSAMQAGRPITLTGADDRAWLPYADLQQLQTWAATPGQQLTLTLRGVARAVVFDLRNGSPISAAPVLTIDNPPAADDPYILSALKFFEV